MYNIYMYTEQYQNDVFYVVCVCFTHYVFQFLSKLSSISLRFARAFLRPNILYLYETKHFKRHQKLLVNGIISSSRESKCLCGFHILLLKIFLFTFLFLSDSLCLPVSLCVSVPVSLSLTLSLSLKH